MPQVSLIDRAQGVMVGLGCGDALGAAVEFLPLATLREMGPITDMVGGGLLQVRPGQTTDDTAMATALGGSIIRCGGYEPRAAFHAYLDWAGRDGLGMGETVGAALRGVASGLTISQATERHHQASGGRSAGNGSVMRCAALAVAYHDQPVQLAGHAHTDSRLTHYDPLAAAAAVTVCALIAAALHDQPPPDFSAAEPAIGDALAADRRLCAFRARSQEGVCTTALAVAHRAWRAFDSFEDGVVWAVNLGGDTDTNAAVTGALLGARFGLSGIPPRWTRQLEGADELASLGADLLDAVTSRGEVLPGG